VALKIALVRHGGAAEGVLQALNSAVVAVTTV
jgi:hypothetical protein